MSEVKRSRKKCERSRYLFVECTTEFAVRGVCMGGSNVDNDALQSTKFYDVLISFDLNGATLSISQ